MKKYYDAVEKSRKLITDAFQYIWDNPETGFKEVKTTNYLAEQFEKLGYTLVKPEDITGFYTVLDTGRPGPEVMLIAELDSVICPDHFNADPVTGAAHACGHHQQTSTLLGVAAALKEEGVLDELCGRIRLCAVPAEELLELEYRQKLVDTGTIHYMGGKPEYLYRGMFDGVDMSIHVHLSGKFETKKGSIGSLLKRVVYKGKQAHAGGSPWDGRNALYAATCGMNAINAIRERFKEEDIVRVHPIITHGGDMVNSIPARVVLETYIRGTTYSAITEANKIVNQALVGAAISIGCNVEIIDSPGFSPLLNNADLARVAQEALPLVDPNEPITHYPLHEPGSTDNGDLSLLFPAISCYCRGGAGTGHGKDSRVADFEAACITNAKWQITMLHLLLSNNAARAKEVIANYEPEFKSTEEYCKFMDSLYDSGDRIRYDDDGNIVGFRL